jgi:hypothetical protein
MHIGTTRYGHIGSLYGQQFACDISFDHRTIHQEHLVCHNLPNHPTPLHHYPPYHNNVPHDAAQRAYDHITMTHECALELAVDAQQPVCMCVCICMYVCMCM